MDKHDDTLKCICKLQGILHDYWKDSKAITFPERSEKEWRELENMKRQVEELKDEVEEWKGYHAEEST